MRSYRLIYSETAKRLISKLHPEIKPIIRAKLDTLKNNPYIGKQLQRDLAGYRSFRANRFRIIYKVNDENNTIEIHYIGRRKDIYEIFAERTGNLPFD